VGGRVFNVLFEGTPRLEDYDVLAHTTDRFVALTEPVADIDVTDGVLNIEFVNVTSFANVRGIQVSVGAVADTVAPVITVQGDNPMDVEYGSTFNDPGATALDNVDGDLTSSIVVGGDTVNTSVLGDYVITYDVQDAAGNNAVQKSRTVHVVDTTVPVITLLGDAEMTVEAGDTFTDPGATASDNYDGDLTGSIVDGGDTVNTLVPDDYVITYNVSDSNGNDAAEVTRTVHIVDTTGPVITLLGANPLSVLQGTTYTDPGATASDIVDGDLSSSIVVGGDTVDTSVIGDYSVTYDVADNAGNDAVQQVRTVSVTVDLPPEITLLGDNPQIVEAGSAYVEAGATASDFEDGDLTSSISIDASAVNTAVLGDYSVEYSVDDSYGHTTTETRTVRVVDSTLPVITLLGANPLMLTVGDSFVDPGAVASDNVDGDLTSSIVVGGAAVNTAVAGDYVITYNVSDSSGNAAVEKTRTVTVESSVPINTFVDDDGSVFEADIEWLAATGITKGCNPPINDMYCPNDPTTRGQMAAFFHRALGSVLSVDLADANVFTDAVGSVFEADIAWLSAAGITQGCNPPQNDLYCASGLVTRGQMAAFLHRGFGSLIGTPTPSGLTFTDTATSVFEADIQWLVDAGITKGCGPDTYCPNDLVTRGQMAAFFHRAYQAAGL
jgi:hypothetical protein